MPNDKMRRSSEYERVGGKNEIVGQSRDQSDNNFGLNHVVVSPDDIGFDFLPNINEPDDNQSEDAKDEDQFKSALSKDEQFKSARSA